MNYYSLNFTFFILQYSYSCIIGENLFRLVIAGKKVRTKSNPLIRVLSELLER